jgi:hypothetical protein
MRHSVGMAYGVVLLPDARTAATLTELSRAIGHGAQPLHQLGPQAPPHVSVLHLDLPNTDRPNTDRPNETDLLAEEVAARARANPVRIRVKLIGLLYVPVPRGDYYVPTGGIYFGIEVVRRPDLDSLHRDYLSFAAQHGMRPLGAVGDDYRPHLTLGVTAVQPALPPLDRVPLGELELVLASGRIGPYGSFPTLGSSPAPGGK